MKLLFIYTSSLIISIKKHDIICRVFLYDLNLFLNNLFSKQGIINHKT